MSGKRLLVGTVVASLCATAAIAIATLLVGDFDDTDARILLTTAAISLYGLLALPGGVLLERRRAVPLAYASLVLAGVGFLLALNAIWAQWDDGDEWAWKSLVIVTAAAGAATQIAAATSRLRAADAPRLRALFFASCALIVVFASLVTAAVLAEIDSEGFFRALGALAVLDVLLLVLQPVLRRARRNGVHGGVRRYQFQCVVEDAPSDLPVGCTATSDGVSCDVSAEDLGAAIGEAVRALERSGGRVRRIDIAAS